MIVHICPVCGHYRSDPILRRPAGIRCSDCGTRAVKEIDMARVNPSARSYQSERAMRSAPMMTPTRVGEIDAYERTIVGAREMIDDQDERIRRLEALAAGLAALVPPGVNDLLVAEGRAAAECPECDGFGDIPTGECGDEGAGAMPCDRCGGSGLRGA